jgi:hypothetical protein
MIVPAGCFSNRIYLRFFLFHEVKKRFDCRVMECEQRLMIKFLTNESVNPHEIHMGLNTQFGEQTHALGTIQF